MAADEDSRKEVFPWRWSLALEAAILHRLFASAVENEMIAKNPVRMDQPVHKSTADPTGTLSEDSGIREARRRAGRAPTSFQRYPRGGHSDTIETVERHYAPFTKELRDWVRGLIDNGD